MKKNFIRLVMSVVAMLTASGMLAGNKVWIENFTVSSGWQEVAILMDNDVDVAAIEFKLIVSSELSVDTPYRNPDRYSNGQQFLAEKNGDNTYTCMVASLNRNNFKGNSGAIAYFKVRNNGTSNDNAVVKLEDIAVSTADGDPVPGFNTQWTATAQLSTISISSSESIAVYPGSTFKLPIALTNSANVQGLQLDVQLPEGFSMSDDFEMTSRVSDNASISLTPNTENNTYRLILVSILGGNAINGIGSGDIFYCNVTAPETLVEGSSIEVKNVIASNGSSSYKGEGVTIAIENGKVLDEERVEANNKAYQETVTAISNLQANLDKVVETINTEYADYKDAVDIEAVQKMINDASEAAKNAYEAVATEGVYSYSVDSEAINAAIDALLESVKAAKDKAEADAEAERVAKNKEAYEKDLAAIDELLVKYREVIAEIQEKYPDYENVSAELKVRNQLDDAKYQVEKAYKACEAEGNYEYELDVEGLQASVLGLLEDAKAAAEKVESDRVAKNKADYESVMQEIADLRDEADAAIEKITTEAPDYNATVEIRAIDKAIAAAEKEAEDAYKSVETAGLFSDAFTCDLNAIHDMISKMVENAATSGVQGIEAEAAAGQAMIFTLDGKRHERLVNGEVNVIVRSNGNTSKIMVK